MDIELKHPQSLNCKSAVRQVNIEPKTQVAIPFELTRVGESENERMVITADLAINGQRLGEVTEALID